MLGAAGSLRVDDHALRERGRVGAVTRLVERDVVRLGAEPGPQRERQLGDLARSGEVGDVEDLDRRLVRGDEVRVGVVEVVAARVHGLVVRALLDVHERDRARSQRVGDVGHEGAVAAGAVGLQDLEAERRRLAVAGRRAVAEGVGRVGHVRALAAREHLRVALGDAAVIDRRDPRLLGIGDVDDLEAVAVRAGQRVLPLADARELDVGAVVGRGAVARLIRQVRDVGHVRAVRVLRGRRGGEGKNCEEGRDGKSAHGGWNAPMPRILLFQTSIRPLAAWSSGWPACRSSSGGRRRPCRRPSGAA